MNWRKWIGRPSRQILTMLRVANEIGHKIPNKDDTVLSAGIKLLGGFDVITRVLLGRESILDDLRARYNLMEKWSQAFVRLFMDTGLAKDWPVTHWALQENVELMEYSYEGERIFIERQLNETGESYASRFYHSPNFPFTTILLRIWDQFPNGMYVGRQHNSANDEPDMASVFLPIKPSKALMSPEGEKRLQQYTTLEGPQTILAIGDPGVGKSLFCERLAYLRADKLLKIDGPTLTKMNLREVEFLFETLKPGMIVVDDFDQVSRNMSAYAGNFLFLMERMQTGTLKSIFLLTINDTRRLDRALGRAGRVNEIIDFGPPTNAERQWLFTMGLGAQNVTPELMELSADYSHAEVAEFVKQVKKSGMDRAIQIVNRLHEITNEEKFGDWDEMLPQAIGTPDTVPTERVGYQGRRPRYSHQRG